MVVRLVVRGRSFDRVCGVAVQVLVGSVGGRLLLVVVVLMVAVRLRGQ